MTDNFEDVEHQETVHPGEQPPATGARSNLSEAWRTRPIFKLLAVMTVAGALIAAASVFFSGGSKSGEASRIGINPPTGTAAPGGQNSPYFIEQTKKYEEQRTKEALEKGGSSLPTPIGQPRDINVTEKTDPMNELRGETERLKQQLAEMKQQQVQRAQQPSQAQAQGAAAAHQQPEQFDQALSQVMQGQMKQLMDSWNPRGIKQVDVSKGEAMGANGAGANGAGGNATQQVPDAGGQLHKAKEKPLIPAGTVSYAQMLTEANSDVPTPILAQIVSGPLSGARAIGSFQIANGYNDYLVLRFNLADKKGKDYRIDAIALDPDTTLGGMETEVDQRYFTRVIMPAAAAFLQGFGQALGQTSSTTSTNGTTTIVSQAGPGITQGIAQGAASAAGTASSFFQNQANETKPLIRVAAGTPMGLFFVSSVYDLGSDQDEAGATSANGCPAGTSPGYAVGGHVVPLPAGVQPNGCYPSNTGGGIPFNGAGYPQGVSLGGGAPAVANAPNGYNDVPYPNYANSQRGYDSPYGGAYGTPNGYYGR